MTTYYAGVAIEISFGGLRVSLDGPVSITYHRTSSNGTVPPAMRLGRQVGMSWTAGAMVEGFLRRLDADFWAHGTAHRVPPVELELCTADRAETVPQTRARVARRLRPRARGRRPMRSRPGFECQKKVLAPNVLVIILLLMMMVRIGETAKKAFATLDLVEHLQVVDALAKLSYFPNVAGVETLTGEHTGLFLLAVARFFIVFSVDGGVVTVERIMSEHL